MPIVGSFAGASARAYGLGAGVLVGDFESISTTTLTTTTSTITFSSIPQTYSHLQIRIFAFGNTTDSGLMRFNSDTATNYSWHALTGNGATASSTNNTTVNFMVGNGFNLGPNSTTIPFVTIIDILDYKDTNKYKTLRSLDGTDRNGSGQVTLLSGNWRSTSAVSSISIAPNTGGFTQYSSFALYGVKA
jgi:hypothetical protein